MKYIKNSVEQNRNSIIFESHPQNAKKELIKMFNPENEVYNPETKRYELIDVELPDDYFIKDIEDGQWVELKPLTFEQKVEMELQKPEIQKEIEDAFPFTMPTDEDLEKMAREFKFDESTFENMIGMEY